MNSSRDKATDAAKRRRKSRVRLLVFIFFLFIGIVMVLESPLTRVRAVAVSGNVSVPQQNIVQASDMHKGMSLWQVNSSEISKQVLDAQPRIQSVDVHTDYFTGTVTLNVKEKEIVAILEESGHFYLLLSDGKKYNETKSSAGFTWPILTTDDAQQTASGQAPDVYVASICRQLSSISRAEANQISEIHVDKYGVTTIYLVNQFAAQCKQEQFASSIHEIQSAVNYFKAKGYAPGLIDLTGGPPYRYTPFTPQTGNKQ